MFELAPKDFLEKMIKHVTHFEKVKNAEKTYQEMAAEISKIENLISRLTEEEINSENVNQEIEALKKQKNSLKSSINNFRPQADGKRRWEETREFIDFYNKFVSYFSIVTLELETRQITFMVIGQRIRETLRTKNLWCMKIDTPIALACFGKQVGTTVNFTSPNGVTQNFKIVNCSLPTTEQMEQVIEAQSHTYVENLSTQMSPFELFEKYGSNNSRLRKGG